MRNQTVHRTILILFIALTMAGAATIAQDSSNPASGTGWLGVMLGDVQAEPADDDGATGVRVRRVLQDGPAMKGGLRAGDIIKEVEGARVNSAGDLIRTVSGMDSGSWITMKIDRRGKSREIRARLDGRPENTSGLKYREGYVGIQAIDLPETLQTHFGAPEKSGVMVSEVDDGSPGYVSGLEPGDVVFEVDGEPVRSSSYLRELLQGAGVGNTLTIRAMRNGLAIVVESEVIDLPDEAREEAERRLKDMRRRRSTGRQDRNSDD